MPSGGWQLAQALGQDALWTVVLEMRRPLEFFCPAYLSGLLLWWGASSLLALLVPGSPQRAGEVEQGPLLSLHFSQGRAFCRLTPEPKLDKGNDQESLKGWWGLSHPPQ